MILAGIILILAELLLIPGVGVAGILGVLSICGASWYAFAVLGPLTGAIVTIFNVVALAVLTCFALRSRTWKKFELNTVIGKNEAAPEVNVGDRGKACLLYTLTLPTILRVYISVVAVIFKKQNKKTKTDGGLKPKN